LGVVVGGLFGLGRQVHAQGQVADTLADDLGIQTIGAAALLEDLLHALHGMFSQKLQHARVVAGAGVRAVPFFQTLA
jgi:hypothetical protein